MQEGTGTDGEGFAKQAVDKPSSSKFGLCRDPLDHPVLSLPCHDISEGCSFSSDLVCQVLYRRG